LYGNEKKEQNAGKPFQHILFLRKQFKKVRLYEVKKLKVSPAPSPLSHRERTYVNETYLTL